MASALSTRPAMRSAVRPAVASRRPVAVRAALDPAFTIGVSTVAALSLGRFVFLPYHRRELNFDSSVPPKTTGNTYFDNLQKDASFTLSTKDPAGFTSIDVLGWGALGHAAGYAALAISSLHDAGVNPWPTV